MPRRTDSRSRMIHAATELFRQRGYHATTVSDVVRESVAPRGSTYCHFPGGKQELAREALARARDEFEKMVGEAADHADDPGSLVRALAQVLEPPASAIFVYDTVQLIVALSESCRTSLPLMGFETARVFRNRL